MPRDDRGEIEMELLQSLESLRILREVREIEIAELLFENAVPVKNFRLREKHEDAIWRMRGTQINRLHPGALQFNVASKSFVGQDARKRWITRRSFLHATHHLI